MATPNREKQIAEAEEMLEGRLREVGFVKGLFFGDFLDGQLLRYPHVAHERGLAEMFAELQAFCQKEVDPVAIDRDAVIPQRVIDGLGRIGVLGACLPTSCGGKELSQTAYCRLIELLGGHCASTALFVNAHHSIGPRALVLFGTPAQQQAFLPKLATGEWISAFALTEPEAGSDAGNVQTVATPTPDGTAFVLNGEKRWITNGGIAKVLTVMARTPIPGSKETKVTAFLVTPDMPGFQVDEARMEKMGVRGTATSRLSFHNMRVPRENILGELGKGLKVALTVLDFGRTTFGASCTGAAKVCLAKAREHANARVQFQQPLAAFEMVKEKLAYMAAGTFAMEAATYQTAALIDSGAGDYMLETAMLKVFATDTLWKILHDTFQIHGGKAYFCDQPFERMVRDARINLIGEGANDVLRAFVALVGMRDVGLHLQSVLNAASSPIKNWGVLKNFAGKKIEAIFANPAVPVRHMELEPAAARLSKTVAYFGSQVEKLLRTFQMGIVDKQYLAGRVADAATELYVSACVLRRLEALLDEAGHHDHDHTAEHSAAEVKDLIATGHFYLLTAERRIRNSLADLWNNDDDATSALADRLQRSAASK
jgi:alkylation response protein AidB-like acyl-CoA dehydrogenase